MRRDWQSNSNGLQTEVGESRADTQAGGGGAEAGNRAKESSIQYQPG